MTDMIDRMIEHTIGLEGRYANHPDDRGGETMWGITIAVARANGYKGQMRHLPRPEAVRIYRQQYFVKPGFDHVAKVYPRVAAELFDTGVNMGSHWPSLWLQMCLNALNNKGEFYDDIAEDADIGPQTINALRRYRQRRGDGGEEVLVRMLDCLQGARYIDITRARQRNESFIFGWFRNRIGGRWK